ncbi:MAG: hypothetical protein IKI47_02325, partial [Prevotella sp.]|nr:hypothetical protein [Prevotella sp.]
GASLSSSTDDALNFQAIQSYFNSTIIKHGSVIKQIVTIQGKRKDSVRARIREHGKKKLAEVFVKSANSDFLNGKNDRGFIASFDWIIRPNNFVKILEGNYDNRTDNGDYESQQRQASVAEAIMRRLAEDDAKRGAR